MTNPDMGPKVNRPEVDKVEEIVNEAIAAGAEVLAGGHRLTEGEFARGHWFEPTVLRVDSNRAPVMQREIFGPVAPVMTVDSFEQALTFANDRATACRPMSTRTICAESCASPASFHSVSSTSIAPVGNSSRDSTRAGSIPASAARTASTVSTATCGSRPLMSVGDDLQP